MSRIWATLLLMGVALTANGHSFDQSIGAYQSSQSLERRKTTTTIGLDYRHFGEALTASTYTLAYSQEQSQDVVEAVETEATGYVSQLQAAQTWQKTGETRQSVSYAKEESVRARAASVGVSEWFHHETFRLSIDMNHQIIERPASEYLDVDSNIVSLDDRLVATGASIGLRQLATPTTILDYGLGQTHTSGRPEASQYSFGVKQFIPATESALHWDSTRYVNRGYVGLHTDYGELDGVETTLAWLQFLWSKAKSRLAYRYYREDETTRAYRDELTYGSDTVTLAVDQEFAYGEYRTYKLHAAASRYSTNADIDARIYELGLGAKF